MKVTNLHGTMARRVYFESEALKAGVRLITGMGHGSYDQFTGHLGNEILEVGKYGAAEVENRIVHLLSCRTAGKLGPDIVKSGATAFFGYSENFVFDVKYESVFFNCALEIDRALVDGSDAARVHERTTATFQREIDSLAGTDGQAAAFLNADLEYLCTPVTNSMFGSSKASL